MIKVYLVKNKFYEPTEPPKEKIVKAFFEKKKARELESQLVSAADSDINEYYVEEVVVE